MTMFFYTFFTLVLIQRMTELFIAGKNERTLKKMGGIEFGSGHYFFAVGIHVSFFISLFIEAASGGYRIAQWWPLWLMLFVLAQGLRVWCIYSLGRFWNTKIIVLPGSEFVNRGPYQFFRHPNYAVVALEFTALSLLFQAPITGILFLFLHVLFLLIRIPAEEKALRLLVGSERQREQSAVRAGRAQNNQ